MRGQIKDKLYYYFAEKNWGVRREYGPYVDAHREEHAEHPWKHRWMLVKLNWHYRVLRRDNMMISKPSEGKVTEKKRRLPYLEGSESSLSNRRSPIHLVKNRLLSFDVISFDIFDTLILRPFSKPTDLFMIVGKRLNKAEFYRIRTDAERRAREEAMQKKGTREITIYDIYRIIEQRTGIPADLGLQTEFETELDYCFANPYMKKVYRLLQEQGKMIVITSDMYLPKEMMEKLLHKNGFTGYDMLYVSCDYGCSKSNGSLYHYVKNDYPGKTIIHVGDNMNSDIKCAVAAGVESEHYRNCHEIGNPYRADGMSAFVESSYSGIVNTYLHNSDKVFSPLYEYGFIYGGLYVLGFCNWIHKRVKQEGIDKILFLSRDGYIYQKVFNMMFDDVPNEYFLWSRIANTKYTVKKNREDFLRRIVYYRALAPFKITAKSLLQSIDLLGLIPYLKEYQLNEKTLLIPETEKLFDQLFIEHWDEVCEAFEPEKDYIRNYIRDKVGNASKVAVIDVGWLGSGPVGLKYLIEEELQLNCQVYCMQAAARPPIHTDIAPELMDSTIEPYIFSEMFNRNHFDVHANTNKGQNNIFFEFFSQATYPSYGGMNADGSFIFDYPEVENYKAIQEIQSGIIDFCSQYIHFFHKDFFALCISGYDAYCPYRMIIRDLSYIKKYFSDYTFARNVSGDTENQRIETIRELLDQAGV